MNKCTLEAALQPINLKYIFYQSLDIQEGKRKRGPMVSKTTTNQKGAQSKQNNNKPKGNKQKRKKKKKKKKREERIR